MKIRSKSEKKTLDMTPMIDVTFLLISFFMMVINFSKDDQNARIVLPSSEFARPMETQPENMITLQVTAQGTIIYGPKEYTLPELEAELGREKRFSAIIKTNFMDSMVIIRGHKNCPTGDVQDVIALCQNLGLDQFSLRASQEQK